MTAKWPASFTSKDRKMFTRFRIPPELLVDADVRRVSHDEAHKALRLRRAGGSRALRQAARRDLAGLLFPYEDPQTQAMVTCRVRRDNPEHDENGKEQDKYLQPLGSRAGRILYYPPGANNLLQDRHACIVLVEAEKSALAITAWAKRRGRANELLAVAMGGCWGWSQKHEPLADLDMFEGRTVMVLLDANLTTNPKVQEAHRALVSALCARHCAVCDVRLPTGLEGVNGPDDLLAQPNGDELLGEVFGRGHKAVVAPHSDDALADIFAEAHANDLRYVEQWGRWLLWDGRRWAIDDTQAVGNRAQDLCLKAAESCGKPHEAKQLRSRRTIEAVQAEASKKRSLAATTSQWDADPWLLGTPKGVVDLRTGALGAALHQQYITKLTDITPSGGKPSRWLRFLREITNGDKPLQEYLQRVAGYCLTGDTREQAMFFLYGTGANGKSVFVSTLLGVLGDYAKVAAMDMFMVTHNPQHPTDLAGLRGARLVAATETEDGSRWAESKIKAITGGEPISARFMRQDFFQYLPQFKLLLSGNHRPRLRNVDESMRRRLQLVPFAVTIPKQDRNPKLMEELRQEWPAILQWMVEGCAAWRLSGLAPPSSVTMATAEYLETQDVIGQWLGEETEADQNARTPPEELYRAFRRWAEGRGEYVCAQKEFSQKLAERGFASKKSNGQRTIALRLKPPADKRKFAGKVVPLRS